MQPKNFTLIQIQKLAREHGGQCLSKVAAFSAETPLVWQCAKKHRWKARPAYIQQGIWCPECTKTITIPDMQQLAQKRGGKCLSDVYHYDKIPLLWQCANGHQWSALPSHVKDGQWCRECFGETQLAMFRKLARKQKGKCLSETYININTPLLWQCAKGHQWEATPKEVKKKIKDGQWCPNC